MAASVGYWNHPCITGHARCGQPLRLTGFPVKGCNCKRRLAHQLQQHFQHTCHTSIAAGAYDRQGNSSDSHDNTDSQHKANSSSHGIPVHSGTSIGPHAAVKLLGRAALLVAVVPILFWSVAWVLDTGLMQLGYTCLWAMTQLGVALFGTSQDTLAIDTPDDYTDLALRTAARLSRGGAAATQLAQDTPAGMSLALMAFFHCWRAVQHAVLGIKLGMPWLGTVAQLCVLCCTATFAITLTPLRPIIASVFGRLLQQPAQSSSASTHSSKTGYSGQQVAALQAAPRAAAIEASMQGVGRLSLVLLMTTLQAAEVSAPPLSGGTLILGNVPAAGGPPPFAASLFAITAPISDVLLPAALAGLAATAAWQALRPSSPTDVNIDDDTPPVVASSHSAGGGLNAGLQTWNRITVAVCALRAVLDAVWLVAVACGQAPGSMSVVRVLGCLMLARLAWRGMANSVSAENK